MMFPRAKSLFVTGGLLMTLLFLAGCETTESSGQTDYYYRYGVYYNDWRYRPVDPRPPEKPVRPVHPIEPVPPVRPNPPVRPRPPVYRPPVRPSPKPARPAVRR